MSVKNILLVGATGVFGERLARQLANMPGIRLIVASRNLARAEILVARLRKADAVAEIMALPFEKHADLPKLTSINPWLVIDASGPFQNSDYSLVYASLETGSHYIDLADARGHILGFSGALNALAQERQLVALTGASTTPALSSAVVEMLTDRWKRVDSIEIAVTPGGASEVGQSVIEAILSYAGRPIPVWRNGRIDKIAGWRSTERWDVFGLGPRWVSPVETADAELLSVRFSVRDRVRFLAGLESRAEHFSILLLAPALRRILGLRAAARFLYAARRLTRPFCGDKGGMEVRVCGLDSNKTYTKAQWSLLAEHNDGPNVPTLAAVACVRSLLAGTVDAGAKPCTGAVSLSDIEREMANFAITTQHRSCLIFTKPLFCRALSETAYASLPSLLLAFHESSLGPVWSGVADIDGSISLIAKLVRYVVGLPKPERSVPVSVTIRRADDEETWIRDFGGRHFVSIMKPSRPGHVIEAIGPFSFDLALGGDQGAITLTVVKWRFFGIRLPRVFAPCSDSREFEDTQRRYCFDVKLTMPFVGLLAHYRGWLQPGSTETNPTSETLSSVHNLTAGIPADTTILVTGASGFIGRRLCESLLAAGHHVIALFRDPAKAHQMPPSFKIISSLDQIADDTKIDAIVNLAGEPIGTQIWTSANRRRFVMSRVNMTRDLINLIERLSIRPSVLVNGSAIGWYGLHADMKLTEKSSANPCFSHELCEAWELTAQKAKLHGVRVVLLRIGLVLGKDGGPLRQMLPLFKLGLGGRFGNGRQWMSWIARDDVIRLIAFAIAEKQIEGALNATAPEPVRNEDFARSLAHAVHRPILLPVPAGILRIVGGDFARELLLGGQRVLPEKALSAGFRFQFDRLDGALAYCLK